MTVPFEQTANQHTPETLWRKKVHFSRRQEKNAVSNDQTGASALPVLVVGIGAAEGALKVPPENSRRIPLGSGVAVVLLHHPQLAGKNLLTLLKRQTYIGSGRGHKRHDGHV